MQALNELADGRRDYVVSTDLGGEFASLDSNLPSEAVHRTKEPEDRNAEAVVDRSMQTIKKDLSSVIAKKGGQRDQKLNQVIDAYNARPHATVIWAPEDIEKKPALLFRAYQDNASKFLHNRALTQRRIESVKESGAFRAPTNASRSFNPQFGKVQKRGSVNSMYVTNTGGREFCLSKCSLFLETRLTFRAA